MSSDPLISVTVNTVTVGFVTTISVEFTATTENQSSISFSLPTILGQTSSSISLINSIPFFVTLNTDGLVTIQSFGSFPSGSITGSFSFYRIDTSHSTGIPVFGPCRTRVAIENW